MSRLAQYSCVFLDITGAARLRESIYSHDALEAIETSKAMWRHRPHYFGLEVWCGARRVHSDVRPPKAPLPSARPVAAHATVGA